MNNDSTWPPETLEALDLLGAVLFLLKPGTKIKGKYASPYNWERFTSDNNDSVISDWTPAHGVGMVCGDIYDVIDVDPRNNGLASLMTMQDEGLLPEVHAVIETPSGGLHLYVSALGLPKGVPLPGIDYQARGGFVFVPPTDGYRALSKDEWPKLRTSKDAPAKLRDKLTRPTEENGDADDTAYADLPGPFQEMAVARWERTVEFFRRQLADAAEWPEGYRDSKGRGWERLVADAAYALARLGNSAWIPQDIDAARDAYLDMLPEELLADPKCRGKWESKEGSPPLLAPWQELFEDFGPMPAEPEPARETQAPTPEDFYSKREEQLFQERLAYRRADERARQAVQRETIANAETGERKDGASFLFDLPSKVPAIWGEGQEVLWAKGEALMIVGPPGVGKTTVTAQIVRGLLGLQKRVLGYPVQEADKVLYLAMDRPQQIARALARTFRNDSKENRHVISERLIPWEGPPPEDLAANPEAMLNMARAVGATVIVVDSLKDAALGLVEDAVGAGYNRARQKCLAAGIEVIELHHQRKSGSGGNGSKPNTLSDVYGSTWLTSGAGSVVLLWGDAGDPIVELRHLKQPMEPVGPFKILHDHTAGHSHVQRDSDPVALAHQLGRMTVIEAAELVYGNKPTKPQLETMRRKLAGLASRGRLTLVEETNERGRPVSVYLPTVELDVPLD